MSPHSESVAQPKLTVTAESHNISVGTTTRIVANTVNVIGASEIHWMKSPDVATLTNEGDNGTTVLFSSKQQGTYTVKAWAKTANGQIVSDETNITVYGVDANGKTLSN